MHAITSQFFNNIFGLIVHLLSARESGVELEGMVQQSHEDWFGDAARFREVLEGIRQGCQFLGRVDVQEVPALLKATPKGNG